MFAPARIDELNGECQEGNGCRSTRKLKIVKWPVRNSPCDGPNTNAGNNVLKGILCVNIRQHARFKKIWLVSRAVMSNRVGYLSAHSGPSPSVRAVGRSPEFHFHFAKEITPFLLNHAYGSVII